MRKTLFRASKSFPTILSAVVLTCLLFPAACDRQNPGAPPSAQPPPEVVVSPVVQTTVPLYREYVARTEARETVVLRSRVDGYLDKVLFEEGSQVAAGQLLFVIDQRPFAAALQEARGGLAQAQAALNKARRDVTRLQPLVAESAAPEADLDDAKSAVELSLATGEKARAAIAMAELNLKFSEIRAPISGIVGKQEVTAGNIVSRDQTLLTSISSWDPMRAVFSISETDYLRLGQQRRDDNPFLPRKNAAPFELIMADGGIYPLRGSLGFLDRTLDLTTGTLNVYVSFPNPERLLRPGLFGRVRVMVEAKPDALLVPQKSVQVIQGVSSVLVVGEDDGVGLRVVTLGERFKDFFVVSQGLEAGQRVVVEGLQKAIPGRKVRPREQPILPQTIGG
ncbi:MAG: efflux RND transporter periplasmic adaptor subunit [Deltaproteobacteria bacterium]|nr:efflux RND transporter periplasmic adaptor subunit [Deltaproteobacteria bacterium]